jgi:hypothetical protein
MGAQRRRIYVASSWRNGYQPSVVRMLRQLGHEVYDFRNPAPGQNGFGWKSLDDGWESWGPGQFRAALATPTAQFGFKLDSDAVNWADTCVLVLPSGRSAHLEAGFMAGSGKELHIFMPQKCEPELMYLWAKRIHLSLDDLRLALHRTPANGSGSEGRS